MDVETFPVQLGPAIVVYTQMPCSWLVLGYFNARYSKLCGTLVEATTLSSLF